MRRLVAALLLVAGAAVAQTAPPAGLPVVAASPGVHPQKPAHAKPAKPGPKTAAKPMSTKPGQATKPGVAPPQAASEPAPPPPKADPAKGSTTGLPLPRWVAFRSDEVNLRSGPGTQYPIDWQYHRRDLPVRILREYEVWRLVETQDGTKGWVHQATLTGRRGFVVVDAERVLRASPDDAAAPVARLQPGVVGHVRACEAAKPWCEVQTGDYRGFVRRTEIWGVEPDEPVS